MKQVYGLYRAAEWLARRWPAAVNYWLGDRVSGICYLVDRTGRAGVYANLRRVLGRDGRVSPPPAELRRLTRETFRHFGRYLVDFFRYGRLSYSALATLVAVAGEEHLREAVAAGRGVMLMSAHVGNWEMGAAALAARGYAVHAVVHRVGTPKLDALLERYRRRRGLRIIPLGDAARGALRVLRRGECLALLADRDFSGRHARVAMCGAPMALPSGPVRLAWATGALIVAGVVVPDETGRYRLVLQPPIDPRACASRADLARRIAGFVEAVVTAYPTHWFMFRDAWNGAEKAALAVPAAAAAEAASIV